MENQLLTMLSLQDTMNTKVNSNWRTQNFEWYRAIWTECAELMDHYGWKWWKNQPADIDQSKLELVDIWHFGLSILLVEKSEHKVITESITSDWSNTKSELGFRELLEQFALLTLQTKSFNVPVFCQLLAALDMPFEELYQIYVGKNVLNLFRQDNGYQDGSYKKLWQGREDNEHLVEVLASLDQQAPDLQTKLYQGLTERYQQA